MSGPKNNAAVQISKINPPFSLLQFAAWRRSLLQIAGPSPPYRRPCECGRCEGDGGVYTLALFMKGVPQPCNDGMVEQQLRAKKQETEGI